MPRPIRLIVCCLLVSCLAPITTAPAVEKVVLQLPWLHQFQFAGYYAAIEQGYYRDAGLDVTVTVGKPGLNSVDEVLSGRAQYGVGRGSFSSIDCGENPWSPWPRFFSIRRLSCLPVKIPASTPPGI